MSNYIKMHFIISNIFDDIDPNSDNCQTGTSTVSEENLILKVQSF